MRIKKQLEQEKLDCERQMEETRQQMVRFKMNKMVILLNSLVIRQRRTYKFSCFNILQRNMIELNLKAKKLTSHA